MHLHLSLPPAGERNATPFTLDSAEAGSEWLTTLPQDDHRKTAKRLLDMLTAMNRTRIRVTLRQDLTELFLHRAREILPRLSDALSDGAVPVSGSTRSAAGLADELLTELCYSYKLLLMEQSRRLFGFASSGRALLPVIRAMQLLSNRLTLGYRLYSSSAKTLWLELHELYQFSARRGFAQRSFEEEVRTPLCIYRDALLLAFAEPLKLMPGDVDRLVAWIAAFGELAVLGAADTRRNGPGLYLVKSQRDVPGYALSKRQHPPAQLHDLVLNTGPIAEAMLDQLSKLQTGATPQSLKLPLTAEQPAFQDLMGRLAKHWSAASNRRHTRLRTHARVELCIGIRGVWEFLHRDKAHCSADWMVTNESARGFALTHMGGNVEPISVGEVVGLRTADSTTCHICIVRWITSDNAEHIELGLEELASSARAISLRKIGDAADLNPQPVLLLPEVASLSQSPAILAPMMLLDTTCELNLGDLQSKLRVKATRLLERTASMQLLQFSAVS
jgi:cyclic-di-GMP-binding protein